MNKKYFKHGISEVSELFKVIGKEIYKICSNNEPNSSLRSNSQSNLNLDFDFKNLQIFEISSYSGEILKTFYEWKKWGLIHFDF